MYARCIFQINTNIAMFSVCVYLVYSVVILCKLHGFSWVEQTKDISIPKQTTACLDFNKRVDYT